LNEDPDGTLGDPDLGTGQAIRQFRDCYWPDQSVRVARNQSIDDAQTVQEFRSVEINIWDNDILPDAFFVNLHIPAADSMLITILPKAGYLTYSGTGRDSRIEYHHDGRAVLTNAVDSFHYKIRFWDSVREQFITDSSAVYIYVLESATGGFSACYGATTTITLANKPLNGVAFNWFDETGEHHIGTGLSRTLQGFIEGDSIYQVQPRITITPSPYNVEFPKGLLTISLATSPQTPTATMRWTGLVNNDWKNPGNWVEVKGTYEAPVAWAPSGCVDVIIPTGAPKYPELSSPVSSRNITMKDRAMLKNPHVLTYDSAKVELKLAPSERDRFVMWSAPLKSMYSGDYHFRVGNTPNWGDVFMNYFQQANPAGGAAEANSFTATFGKPNEALPLGKAFNLKVIATVANRDSSFVFPRMEATYTADGGPYATPRSATSYKFITDGLTLNNNGQFTLPVVGGSLNASMIQIVNPYMAYLRVSEFLAANSTKLGAGYYIWHGDVNEGIISVLNPIVNGNRYTITTSLPTATSADLIPPLKSFFAGKINSAEDLSSSLVMSPAWTTTAGDNPYTLRASTPTPETHILRIKASQGEKSSYAVLYYNLEAIPSFRAQEDVRQLFYDEIPLTVYSLTSQGDPLAINSNAIFSGTTNLGLRVRDGGEITLEFSGMSTFGYNAFLTDKVLSKEIDLQKVTSYTFTLAKASGTPLLELNDRFSLRLQYTGNGLSGNEAPPALPNWSVSTSDGYIHIQSLSGTIDLLHIYSVTGALVYASASPATHFSVALEGGVYFVKALIGNENKVEKVILR
jgi:hypothetical protein